jgi:hypothetical protein
MCGLRRDPLRCSVVMPRCSQRFHTNSFYERVFALTCLKKIYLLFGNVLNFCSRPRVCVKSKPHALTQSVITLVHCCLLCTVPAVLAVIFFPKYLRNTLPNLTSSGAELRFCFFIIYLPPLLPTDNLECRMSSEVLTEVMSVLVLWVATQYGLVGR